MKLKTIKFEKVFFVIASLLMAIPSIRYLIVNKSIINFLAWFTFFLKVPNTFKESVLGACVFGILLVFIFIFYFRLLKNTNSEFKTLKSIIIYVLIISVFFAIMLPFTTSDIFYYMGTGRIDSHYNKNPYYTTVSEIRLQNPNDEILQRTGLWEEQVVVYGPVWAFICKILSFLSFGNVTIALYIFKVFSIIIHILNIILVFKITKKKKFAVLYGLNPFILFEMIANVHNDLYMIFFVLSSLYFLLRKKNIILTVVLMAIATCVKYVAILLVPFFVLYYLRNKPILKKLLYCFLYSIIFIIVCLICYLPYSRNLGIFFIIFMQQDKYRESILAITQDISDMLQVDLIGPIKILFIMIFAMIYISIVIKHIMEKNIRLKETLRNCNSALLLFLFFIITNLCPWYASWFIPTLFWQKGRMIKNIFYFQFSYELVTTVNFALFTELYKIGLFYLPMMYMICLVFHYIDSKRIKKRKQIIEEQKKVLIGDKNG